MWYMLVVIDSVLRCRHPSRLQDNMMPMSPDDYKVLAQYVSPRDIDAVVSTCTALNTAVHSTFNKQPNCKFWFLNGVWSWENFSCMYFFSSPLNGVQPSVCLSVFSLPALLSGQQSDFWIWRVWRSGRRRFTLSTLIRISYLLWLH